MGLKSVRSVFFQENGVGLAKHAAPKCSSVPPTATYVQEHDVSFMVDDDVQ